MRKIFWAAICQQLDKAQSVLLSFPIALMPSIVFSLLLPHCQFCLPLLSPMHLSIPIKRGIPQFPCRKIIPFCCCSNLKAVFREGPLCEEYCLTQCL